MWESLHFGLTTFIVYLLSILQFTMFTKLALSLADLSGTSSMIIIPPLKMIFCHHLLIVDLFEISSLSATVIHYIMYTLTTLIIYLFTYFTATPTSASLALAPTALPLCHHPTRPARSAKPPARFSKRNASAPQREDHRSTQLKLCKKGKQLKAWRAMLAKDSTVNWNKFIYL